MGDEAKAAERFIGAADRLRVERVGEEAVKQERKRRAWLTGVCARDLNCYTRQLILCGDDENPAVYVQPLVEAPDLPPQENWRPVPAALAKQIWDRWAKEQKRQEAANALASEVAALYDLAPADINWKTGAILRPPEAVVATATKA